MGNAHRGCLQGLAVAAALACGCGPSTPRPSEPQVATATPDAAPPPDPCEERAATVVSAIKATDWDAVDAALAALRASRCPAGEAEAAVLTARQRFRASLRGHFPQVAVEAGAECIAWAGFRPGDAVPKGTCWQLQKLCRRDPGSPTAQEYAAFVAPLVASREVAAASLDAWLFFQQCYARVGDAAALAKETEAQARAWHAAGDDEPLARCLSACRLKPPLQTLISELEGGRVRVPQIRARLHEATAALQAGSTAAAITDAEHAIEKIDFALAGLPNHHAERAALTAERDALARAVEDARKVLRAALPAALKTRLAALSNKVAAHKKRSPGEARFTGDQLVYEDVPGAAVEEEIRRELSDIRDAIANDASTARVDPEPYLRMVAAIQKRFDGQTKRRTKLFFDGGVLAHQMCDLTGFGAVMPTEDANLRAWRKLEKKLQAMKLRPPRAGECYGK